MKLEELPVRNEGARESLGWRANRLTDRPRGIEAFGTVGISIFGIAMIAFALTTLFLGLGDPSAKDVSDAPLILLIGLALLAFGSLTVGQIVYRRVLRRSLQERGVKATARVLDRWRFRIGGGAGGCVRFRYSTTFGVREAFAWDAIELIWEIPVDAELPLVYDRDDPARLLIADQSYRLARSRVARGP